MLKIGDRVSRQINIGEPERRYGNIIEIYRTTQGIGFTPHKLYAIKWDDEENIQKGYLEVSLQKE